MGLAWAGYDAMQGGRHLNVALSAILFFLTVLLFPQAVLAHAELLETIPADGSLTQTPPEQITLRFNEPVTAVSLNLVDTHGQHIPTAKPPETATATLTIPVLVPLPLGSYLASYRIVSADAHVVGGSFTFAVQIREAVHAPAPNVQHSPSALRVFLRILQDTALLFAAGGALFQALVRYPAPPSRTERHIWSVAAAIAGTTALVGLGVIGSVLSPKATDIVTHWRLGADTTAGRSTLVLCIAAAALVVLLHRPFSGAARLAVILAASVAAASPALTGHAAARGWQEQSLLALHAVTAAFWIGAFWPLLRALRGPDRAETARIVRRFSDLAVPAVGLLVGVGLIMTILRLQKPGDLLDSTYGQLLLLKLGLMAALLGIAAANRLRDTPALETTDSAATRLRRNIGVEIGLALGVLAATGLLTHTSPPHAGSHRPPAENRSVVLTMKGVTLRLDHRWETANHVRLALALTDQAGAAVDPIGIDILFSQPSSGIEPLTRRPDRTGAGQYELMISLPAGGRWSARIEALVTDFEKVVFTADLSADRVAGHSHGMP